MIQHVETAVAAGGPTLTQFQNVIRAIVEINAKSPHEQRVLIHDLSFLNEEEQQAIKDLERQLVDIVTDLLVRVDAEGRIVKRTKTIYTMILFGIINYTYTWYEPKSGIGRQEFVDTADGLYMHFFAPAVDRSDVRNYLTGCADYSKAATNRGKRRWDGRGLCVRCRENPAGPGPRFGIAPRGFASAAGRRRFEEHSRSKRSRHQRSL